MVTAKNRGNDIEFDGNVWVYSDTKETVPDNHKDRHCGHCGKNYTKEGHDNCLGTLQGLMNACCGHGDIEEAYVQFWDGSCIRGEDAKIIQDILKKHEVDITDEDYQNHMRLIQIFMETDKTCETAKEV
jgi:hypothetical protein